MKKNLFKKALCTGICLAMILTAFASCGEKEASDEVNRDDVIQATQYEPTTLDTTATVDREDVHMQLYDTLVVDDEDNVGQVKPSLAESWELAKDGKSVDFKIRQDVKFHNGDTLTAEDVAYSINMAAKSAYSQAVTASIKAAKAVDDSTVHVELKYSYSPILSCFACSDLSILNKKAHEKDADAFGRNPVGTGPYKLVEWTIGDKIVLEAFDDYWRGKAPIKKMEYKMIPDISAACIALENGDVDFLINPDQADRQSLIDNEKLSFSECDSASYILLSFNNSGGIFADKKLRTAISHAIDRENIITGAKEGVATPVEAAMIPMCAEYPDNFKAKDYDVAKAKRLLAEAGYPDGLTVTMKTIDSEVYYKPTEIIQEQLRAIGIEVKIEVMERGKWINDVVVNGDYDMTVWAIPTPVIDADSCMYSQFHSSGIGGNGNFAGCNIPELDQLLERGRESMDSKERKEIYGKACEIIKEESVIVPLYSPKRQIAADARLKGITVNPALKVFTYDYSWK